MNKPPEDLRAAHHRERKARNAREWRAKHPEEARLRDKLYHEKYKQKRTEDAKKYYEEHKNDANFVELRKARSIKYYYANLTKARARSIVGKAVRRGKLAKPTICSSCAMEKPIEGHHPDYSKPLEVVWLCKACHEALHHKGQAIATAQANIHSVFGGKSNE